MKKIFFIVLISYSIVLSDDNYELKLYETLLPSIFKSMPIVVYADEDTKMILNKSKYFKINDICDKSVDVVVGKNFKNIPHECKDKLLFATSYRWFKAYQNSVGAFYWRKGRPQLRLKKAILNQHHISLPSNLAKYVK